MGVTGAGMTQAVGLFRKQTAGTTPEAWEMVAPLRNARITRISDRQAIEEGSRFRDALNMTHFAYVNSAGDYVSSGHGNRLLVRRSDNAHWLILRAVGTGRERPDGSYRYMRLSLAPYEHEDAPRITP